LKGIPNGKYTKEFREEAVKLVTEEKLSVPESARRISLPPSTLDNWLKKHKEGKLREVKNQVIDSLLKAVTSKHPEKSLSLFPQVGLFDQLAGLKNSYISLENDLTYPQGVASGGYSQR
jgi:hypothetical protein